MIFTSFFTLFSFSEVFYSENVLFIFLQSTSPFGAVNSLSVKYEVGLDVELGVSCSLRMGQAARPFRSLPLVYSDFISGTVSTTEKG